MRLDQSADRIGAIGADRPYTRGLRRAGAQLRYPFIVTSAALAWPRKAHRRVIPRP
jgi:hypothetical protein